MGNLTFHARLVALLFSAATTQAVADPSTFAAKVAERVRRADGRLGMLPTGWLLLLANRGESETRALANVGELTKGLAASGSRRADRKLKHSIREQLGELQAVPAESVAESSSADVRVLHYLTNSLPHTMSGYAVRSHNVLLAQIRQGIDARAITRPAYPVLVGQRPASDEETLDGVRYARILKWHHPGSLRRRREIAVEAVVAAARKMDATVLHTTTDYANALVVSEAARMLDVPWVYEVRGELEATWVSRQSDEARARASEFFRLAREQETRCMKAAAGVVALSEVSRRQLIERGISEDKISVVPNAVTDEDINRSFDRAHVRRELGLPEAARIVGTVTAVVDYEGLDTLINALEYLDERFRVLIVGEGQARPELENQAERLGLSDRVIFAGRQDEKTIWKWYAALDVFAVPRKDTPVCRTVTPIKSLTAMALGIPVVASDLPALREVTGGFAEYVPAHDAEILARAIASQHGREQHPAVVDWLESRTWKSNGRRYDDLYRSLIKLY